MQKYAGFLFIIHYLIHYQQSLVLRITSEFCLSMSPHSPCLSSFVLSKMLKLIFFVTH